MGCFAAGPRQRRRFATGNRGLGLGGLIALAGVLAVVCPVTSTTAGTILPSSLDVGTTSNSGVSHGQWMAAAFRTTSDLTQLTVVVLDSFHEGSSVGGSLSVDIRTSQASNAGPGTLVSRELQELHRESRSRAGESC